MSAAIVGRVFLDQVCNLFHEMLGLPLTGGRPSVKRDRASGFMVNVSTTLTGGMAGTVALGMEPAVAFAIVNRMLNERRCQLGPDVTDAVGEVTNILIGQARAKLSTAGYPGIIAGFPAVTYGRGQSLTFPEGAIPTQIPFTSSQGALSLFLALAVTTPANPAAISGVAELSTGGGALHDTVAPLLQAARMLPVAINAATGPETQGVLLAMSDRELTLLVDPTIEHQQLTVHLRAPMPQAVSLDLSVATSRVVANFREVVGAYRLAS